MGSGVFRSLRGTVIDSHLQPGGTLEGCAGRGGNKSQLRLNTHRTEGTLFTQGSWLSETIEQTRGMSDMAETAPGHAGARVCLTQLDSWQWALRHRVYLPRPAACASTNKTAQGKTEPQGRDDWRTTSSMTVFGCRERTSASWEPGTLCYGVNRPQSWCWVP